MFEWCFDVIVGCDVLGAPWGVINPETSKITSFTLENPAHFRHCLPSHKEAFLFFFQLTFPSSYSIIIIIIYLQ